jgi:hypothetical protein
VNVDSPRTLHWMPPLRTFHECHRS